MTSQEYWRQREETQRRKNLTDEAEYQKELTRIYTDMMDSIQKEIDAFYAKYASKEGITLAEAKRRVSKLDMDEYSRKAKKYVADRDFSKQANQEMRLYNLTMKVNRLELLKANIGMELTGGFDEMQKFFEQTLNDRTMEEFARQAGILGKSVQNNARRAHAIVNASFHNAAYSDRIWMHQDLLKAEISKQLERGLIQGKGSRELARELRKTFDVSRSDAERLMTTELRRVQTEAAKQSYERNGNEEYTFLATNPKGPCEVCEKLDGRHFKVIDMMPGKNAPPMHPRCHCTTAPHWDQEEFDRWLDEENRKMYERTSGEKENSKPKYRYSDTVVAKKLLKSSQYRRKFEKISENTKLNRTAWKISKRMLEHRSGSRYEDLAFIDSVTGKSIVNENYNMESKAKPSRAMLKMLNDANHKTVIAIHNHPGSSVPSLADIMVCKNRKYKYGLVVCHDGTIYKYSVDEEKFNKIMANYALERLEKTGYTEKINKILADSGVEVKVF